MSRINKKQKSGRLLLRVVVTSALGAGLMLILTILAAWLILNNTVGEKAAHTLSLTAVFLGGMLSSALNHHSFPGAIPRICVSALGYWLLLLPLMFLGGSKAMNNILDWKVMVCVLSGSFAGLVTNLVKSNKSYINKSTRKRMIT